MNGSLDCFANLIAFASSPGLLLAANWDVNTKPSRSGLLIFTHKAPLHTAHGEACSKQAVTTVTAIALTQTRPIRSNRVDLSSVAGSRIVGYGNSLTPSLPSGWDSLCQICQESEWQTRVHFSDSVQLCSLDVFKFLWVPFANLCHESDEKWRGTGLG